MADSTPSSVGSPRKARNKINGDGSPASAAKDMLTFLPRTPKASDSSAQELPQDANMPKKQHKHERTSVTFEPGNRGITLLQNGTEVQRVSAEGQAHGKGVKVGWHVIAVNGQPYTKALWQSSVYGNCTYEVTFDKAVPGFGEMNDTHPTVLTMTPRRMARLRGVEVPIREDSFDAEAEQEAEAETAEIPKDADGAASAIVEMPGQPPSRSNESKTQASAVSAATGMPLLPIAEMKDDIIVDDINASNWHAMPDDEIAELPPTTRVAATELSEGGRWGGVGLTAGANVEEKTDSSPDKPHVPRLALPAECSSDPQVILSRAVLSPHRGALAMASGAERPLATLEKFRTPTKRNRRRSLPDRPCTPLGESSGSSSEMDEASVVALESEEWIGRSEQSFSAASEEFEKWKALTEEREKQAGNFGDDRSMTVQEKVMGQHRNRRKSCPDRTYTPLGKSSGSSSEAEDEVDDDIVKSTFIMVGLSQHGKTTTIDALLRGQGLQGVPQDSIGNGNVRCTHRSSLHVLHRPDRPTCLRRSKPWKTQASSSSSSAKTFQKMPSKTPSSTSHASPNLLGAQRLPGLTSPRREPAYPSLEMDAEHISSEDAATSRRMWLMWKNDQNYKAEVRKSKPVRAHCDGPHMGKCIQFQALDTPGLEDSHGGDIDNMANIMEALTSGQITHISGMVMVIKCGAPFSPAWRRQVEWYWKQFPQLHSQWIFVHTNADPIGFNAKERNAKNTCFERECMDRKQQMLEVMRQITGTEMDCLMHIFVENFIPSNEFGYWEPGQEALRHCQTSTHNRLYSLLAHFPIITLGEMPLVKGPDMLALDELMRAHLDSDQHSMIRTLQEVEMELSEYMSLLKDHMQQKQDMEINIDHRERELKEKDSDALQLLKSKDLHVDYDFWQYAFRRPRAECSLTFSHKLRSRKIVNDPTYARCFVERDDVKDGTWHVRVCGSMFRSIQCDMLAYTHKKDYHAKEIKRLKSELEIFRTVVAKQEQHLSKLQETERHKRNQVAESEARLLYCQELLGHLTRDMSLKEYCNVAAFYKSAIERRWPAPKCCEELASVLEVQTPTYESFASIGRCRTRSAPALSSAPGTLSRSSGQPSRCASQPQPADSAALVADALVPSGLAASPAAVERKVAQVLRLLDEKQDFSAQLFKQDSGNPFQQDFGNPFQLSPGARRTSSHVKVPSDSSAIQSCIEEFQAEAQSLRRDLHDLRTYPVNQALRCLCCLVGNKPRSLNRIAAGSAKNANARLTSRGSVQSMSDA